MHLLSGIGSFIMNIDANIVNLVGVYGPMSYLFLFGIIFCETGLFMAVFLPEESLLFVIGSLCASGSLSIFKTIAVILLATFFGDSLNYAFGRMTGAGIMKSEKSWLIKKEHLEKTQAFYDKHGPKTVIIGRTIPIVRTFVPFVVGMSGMKYPRFISCNMLGAAPWLLAYSLGGFFFGNIPFVKDNFALVIIMIIAAPLIPGGVKKIAGHLKRSKKADDICA